jgi:probable rRNA maturation factor
MPSPEPLVVFRRVPATLHRQEIERFGKSISGKFRLDFTCLITGDSELRRLNRQFRGKDHATDVLSFPGSNELVISYQRARVQAAEFGHNVADEIKVLMLHGALHLLGMDHESDTGEMARRESFWRRKLGLPTGLIARSKPTVTA